MPMKKWICPSLISSSMIRISGLPIPKKQHRYVFYEGGHFTLKAPKIQSPGRIPKHEVIPTIFCPHGMISFSQDNAIPRRLKLRKRMFLSVKRRDGNFKMSTYSYPQKTFFTFS